MKTFKICTSVFILFLFVGFYTEEKSIPSDLSKETILFLKLDSAIIPTTKADGRLERIKRSWMKIHNKQVIESNEKLIKSAKKYPYKYIIGNRKDIEKYKAEGVKYLLDYQPFRDAPNGIHHSDGKTFYTFPIYIIDLGSGKTYFIDDFNENHMYQYNNIIKRVLNLIK